MSKFYQLLLILCLALPLAFTSCNPENDDELEEIEFICEHDSLIHINAVPPTFYTNGCIEHYVCPDCLATFLDAEGTIPAQNVILWARGYTRWQDNYYYYFTQEEYLEFYELMEQVQTLFGDGAKFEIGGFILQKLLAKTFEALPSILINFLDDEGNVPPFEEQALASLSRIEAQLDQMLQMMKEQTYRTAMDARNQDVLAAYNETNAKFFTLLNIVRTTPLDQLSEAQYNSVMHMLDQWYDHGFLGGTGLGSTKSLLGRYVARYSTDGKSYPEIYDEYAYFTYPWEHQGYNFRIACRLVDQMVIAEVYEMSCLYLYFHHDEMPEAQYELDELHRLMTLYGETLDDHIVDQRYDYRICQIPGAAQNMKFYTEVRDLNLFNYIADRQNECWEAYNHSTEDFKRLIDNMLCSTAGVDNTNDYVNIDVYKAIYNFYNRDGQHKSMADCLREADFDNVMENCQLVPYNNREYWYNGSKGNRYKSFDKDSRKGKNNRYWFGMQVLKDDCNGTEVKEIANEMTLEMKHCHITNMGNKTNNNFQVIRKVKE